MRFMPKRAIRPASVSMVAGRNGQAVQVTLSAVLLAAAAAVDAAPPVAQDKAPAAVGAAKTTTAAPAVAPTAATGNVTGNALPVAAPPPMTNDPNVGVIRWVPGVSPAPKIGASQLTIAHPSGDITVGSKGELKIRVSPPGKTSAPTVDIHAPNVPLGTYVVDYAFVGQSAQAAVRNIEFFDCCGRPVLSTCQVQVQAGKPTTCRVTEVNAGPQAQLFIDMIPRIMVGEGVDLTGITIRLP
jgi:hypothetical protein